METANAGKDFRGTNTIYHVCRMDINFCIILNSQIILYINQIHSRGQVAALPSLQIMNSSLELTRTSLLPMTLYKY